MIITSKLRAELNNFRIIIGKIATLKRKYTVKDNGNEQKSCLKSGKRKKVPKNDKIREYNMVFRIHIIALLNALPGKSCSKSIGSDPLLSIQAIVMDRSESQKMRNEYHGWG